MVSAPVQLQLSVGDGPRVLEIETGFDLLVYICRTTLVEGLQVSITEYSMRGGFVLVIDTLWLDPS